MSTFLDNARQIFEVARQSTEPEELTIRVSAQGGIFIVSGADHSGTLDETTYHVRRHQGCTEVEGRSGTNSCTLRSAAAPRSWMADRPLYCLAG